MHGATNGRRTGHFEALIAMLAEGIPFGFARFNDGEMQAIRRMGGRVSRGAQAVWPGLSRRLRWALEHEQQRYWKGAPCSICYPEDRALFDRYVRPDDPFRTRATLLINRNWERFLSEFPAALGRRRLHWCGGRDQDPSALEDRLSIRLGTVLNVPARNAWRCYGRIRKSMEAFDKGDVVGLSCGPLGRVLVAEWYRRAPDVTFIDLGSTLDPLTRNVWHPYQCGELEPCPECN